MKLGMYSVLQNPFQTLKKRYETMDWRVSYIASGWRGSPKGLECCIRLQIGFLNCHLALFFQVGNTLCLWFFMNFKRPSESIDHSHQVRFFVFQTLSILSEKHSAVYFSGSIRLLLDVRETIQFIARVMISSTISKRATTESPRYNPNIPPMLVNKSSNWKAKNDDSMM